jgi:hypothetical protein
MNIPALGIAPREMTAKTQNDDAFGNGSDSFHYVLATYITPRMVLYRWNLQESDGTGSRDPNATCRFCPNGLMCRTDFIAIWYSVSNKGPSSNNGLRVQGKLVKGRGKWESMCNTRMFAPTFFISFFSYLTTLSVSNITASVIEWLMGYGRPWHSSGG